MKRVDLLLSPLFYSTLTNINFSLKKGAILVVAFRGTQKEESLNELIGHARKVFRNHKALCHEFPRKDFHFQLKWKQIAIICDILVL